MSRPPDLTAKISLLRASEAVFAEKGLQAAKVEEITKRAGLSKGAFYLHFDSKEEAFKHVVESFLAHCEANLPAPDEKSGPIEPSGALATWLEIDTQLYEFLWQNRAILAILQGCQGDYVYLFETFNQNIHKKSQEWIDFWKERSFFRRELDTDLAATLLCGAHHELSRRMLASNRKPPIVEWLRKTQSIFVRGFGTPLLVEALHDNPPVSENVQTQAEPTTTKRTRLM
jgi:AcrR family transcriptional regulator